MDVRHLQWLMGKLQFRWRNLMASQQEQCALLGKVVTLRTPGCQGASPCLWPVQRGPVWAGALAFGWTWASQPWLGADWLATALGWHGA